MNKLDFVDAHAHFYDMQHPELFYGHWQPGEPHPKLGMQMQKLAERNYFAEDYIMETRNANVTKVVHIQAAIGSKDPVKETEWLQEAASRTGFPHAIVAYADLRDPNIQETLERHTEYPNMRGIRDFSHGDYLVNDEFHRGFSLLGKYNLISSIAVEWHEMAKLRDLAVKFPETPIVMDHTGLPWERTSEYFEQWKKGMSTAAEATNIICKISGLGMADNNWTVDSIKPYVMASIEIFGVERCLFATNWPVDSLWSSYDAVVDAYTSIISDFSLEEQISMFSRTTEKLYRI